MKFTPRPYQVNVKKKALTAWENGRKSPLIHAATGAGKTIIACMIMDALPKDARIIFNVHTKDLVRQPIEKMQTFFPDLANDAGIVQGQLNHIHKRIMCCTFQSLYASGFRRLKEIIRLGPIDYIFEDECHRAASPKRVEIIKILKEANPNIKILGMSATPFRADGKGMANIFDHLIQPPLTMKYLTGMGYLVPFPESQVFRFDLPVDFKQLKQAKNNIGETDYTLTSIENLFDVDNIHDIMFTKWWEYGSEFKTVCFTATVAQAKHLAEYFAQRTIKTAVVAGNKKDTGIYTENLGGIGFREMEREALLKEYEHGDIQIVFNCAVLTEGFDAPVTQCIMLARPVKSPGVFVQMLGRGARLFPSSAPTIDYSQKKWCRVLAFAGLNAEAMLMPADMNGRRPKERKAIDKAVEEEIMLPEEVIGDHGLGIDCPPDTVLVKQVNLLCKSKYAWLMDEKFSATGIGSFYDQKSRQTVYHGIAVTRPGNGVSDMVLDRIDKAEQMWHNLTEDHRLKADMMKRFISGGIAVWYYQWSPDFKKKPQIIGVFDDIKDAIERGENYAEAIAMVRHSDNTGFMKKKAKFRKKELSPSMSEQLKSMYNFDFDGVSADMGSKSLYWKFAKECFGI